MKLQFLGANGQVTGSCSCLTVGGKRILIDCGLFQEPELEERNRGPFAVPPDQIDLLLLTHAHLDHCGLIPRLVREGFAGRILATAPTIELARLVLTDAAHIQEEEHKHGGDAPIYTERDVERAVNRMEAAPYWEPIRLGDDLAVRFWDAGHILGSAMIELAVREAGRSRRLIFSGDIGQWDRPLVRDPSVFEQADYVVMESTYGDSDHPHDPIEDTLARIIGQTAEAGGKILIPTFAIERAQEIMFYLSWLSHEGRIPHIKAILDSPMAVEATEVFQRHAELLDRQTSQLVREGESPLGFTGLDLIVSREDSMAVNDLVQPAIIMAGAGMCTGGRILHHLAHHIGEPECTILFTGYQARHTLGRQILDGASVVSIDGRTHPVRARVERLHGLSAHADRSELIRWLSHLKTPPVRLFLNHSEAGAARSLADQIRSRGWSVSIPRCGDSVELT